jgi:hypothetical protein
MVVPVIVPVVDDEVNVDFSNAYGAGTFFRGLPPQRMGGRGLGSAIRSRFQTLLPLIRAATGPIVREAAAAAGGVFADVAQDRRPFEISVKRRGGKAVRRLLKRSIETIKQAGGRRKAPSRRKVLPRAAKRQKKKIVQKNKKVVAKDALGKYKFNGKTGR